MTGWSAFKASYDLATNTDVVGQTTPDSVDTADVGNIGLTLAAGLEPFIDAINAFVFWEGTADPNTLPDFGTENDVYEQTNGGTSITKWRKTTTTWAVQSVLPLGIAYNDGIIIGLRTQIDVTAQSVMVTSGNWAINNTIYNKATQTFITYDTPVVGSDRIDTIYSDTLGQILYLAGAPSGSPVKPVLPANTIEVDSIYVPALGTGNAYLFSAGSASNITEAATMTATDADLISDGGGGFYLNNTMPIGYVPSLYAVVTKAGVKSYPPISMSLDGTTITGFTDNDTQTIAIKFI